MLIKFSMKVYNSTIMAEITLSQFYPVPKEKVWEYLTNDELLSLWLMPTENFLLEKGREFSFKSKPSKYWNGAFVNTVIDFEENSFLSYKSVCEELKLDTVITWKLIEKNGGTKLSLTHSGFRFFGDFFARITLTGNWEKMVYKDLHYQLTRTR